VIAPAYRNASEPGVAARATLSTATGEDLKIIHVDMDAFYTSIEQRDQPELRGRPVVVGGDPRSRGVVAAASYEARRFGIHSAMPCREAYRRCSQAVFLPPRIGYYAEVGRQIRAIFHTITDLVEPLSLDEAYLDVTENHLGEPLARALAVHVKARIKAELDLTASAGVGPSKFIAKIASDLRKPDGLVVIPPERVAEFVAGLPIEKLWSVGPATAARLHALGIRSGADLRARPVTELRGLLGKHGEFLHGLAHGIDERRVTPWREPKSKGSERTFAEDVSDLGALLESLDEQVERVLRSLDKLERTARTVTVKVRYADFTTITRSRTLPRGVGEARVLHETAADLLIHQSDAGRRPVRLIGVSVGGFVQDDGPAQLPLPGV